MKSRILLSLLACFLGLSVYAQQPHQPAKEPDYQKTGGLAFDTSPIGRIFDKARAVNKPVFVEIYSPDCPHCQELMPVFASKKAGDFYNERFVCTKLVFPHKETLAFLEQKKLTIPEIPFLLFFTPDGTLIHASQTDKNEDAVINVANTALNPEIRSASYPQHFANGVRTTNFLLEYGLITIVTRDLAANKAVLEAYAQVTPVSDYASDLNWAVLQKRIQHVDNPIAQHLINHQEQYARFGKNDAQGLADRLISQKLYGPDAGTMPIEQVLQLRGMLEKIGIAPALAATRTLLPEINAYFRSQQTEKAVERVNTYQTKSPLTLPECIFVVRYFNQNSPTIADVSDVSRWAQKGLKETSITLQQKADLYYELAEACRRGNQLQEARKAAQESMKAAQAGKLDTKRNTEQLKALE